MCVASGVANKASDWKSKRCRFASWQDDLAQVSSIETENSVTITDKNHNC